MSAFPIIPRAAEPARFDSRVFCTLRIVCLPIACSPTIFAHNANDDFDLGANDPVAARATQVGGKLLVAGTFTRIGGDPGMRLPRLRADGMVERNHIARRGADGSVDTVERMGDVNNQIKRGGFK